MINYGRKIVADEKVVEKLGMLQAQILAQVDYWTERTNNSYDGFKWVYNSLNDWHKQFSWVALSTLKRAFLDLEKQGLLITANFNKIKYDRTKWYRVDYDKLDKLMTPKTAKIVVTYTEEAEPTKPTDKPIVQNEPMDKSNLTQTESVKMNQPIPRDYQEITSNINKTQISKSQSETSQSTNNSQSVDKGTKQQPSTPTKSNKRYFQQFKQNRQKQANNYYGKYGKKIVEKGTDWSKKKAKTVNVDTNAIQQFFANLESKVFSGQLQA